MSSTVAAAFVAGAAAVLAGWDLLGRLAAGLGARAPALARDLAGLVDVVVRLGREGRDPGAAERRRLLLVGSLVAFLVGAALAGPLAGMALAAGGPWAVSRALRARRRRYGRAVEDGVAQLALALADALGGGHSLRAAIGEAAAGVDGAAGHELRCAAAELSAGATTDGALEAMRRRVSSPRLDTVVAGCLLQRRAGGDLARLLRESARAMEDQARLDDEVKAATAQARFTGLIVILMPVGGALLAELASPGWFAGLWSSFLTAWLVGIALGLAGAGRCADPPAREATDVSGALGVVLAFVSAALAVTGLVWVMPPAGAWRGKRGTRTRIMGMLVALGTRLRSGGGTAQGDLRARLAAAGDPAGLGVRELMAAKLGAALVAGVAGTLVASVAPGRLGFAVVLAAPVAGFLAPDVWLARLAAERARRVRRELPALLDLLRVTVESGASLGEALRAVGGHSDGPLAEELRAVGRQVALGVPLAAALDDLVERLPLPEVRALVRAIDRARRHGAPLADTLAAQARDARFALARRIREEAARAGPKIQLVVALLLVPSVLLLVAAALAAALLDGGEVLPV